MSLSLSSEDYETIEAAVLETARGRWFLNEYARRNRTADTNALLDAISKLEKIITAAPQADSGSIDQINEIGTLLSNLRHDLEKLQHGPDAIRIAPTSSDLASIPAASEQVTQQILSAVQDVQETAWALRELGVNAEFCQKIDRAATDIYAACAFQEITAKRTEKIIHALNNIEKCVMPLETQPDCLINEEKSSSSEPEKTEASELEAKELPLTLQYIQLSSKEPEVPASATLLAAQSINLPQSSLPQIHAVLSDEWPREEDIIIPQPPKAANTPFPPIAFRFADYSFEEKLALFS